MKLTRTLVALALLTPALAAGCKQTGGGDGGAGAAFPPPMMGAMAPTVESGDTVIVSIPTIAADHQPMPH